MITSYRQRRSIFHDDNGFLKGWIEFLLWGMLFAAIGAGVWILLVYLTKNNCTYPNHLVYTGWNWELVGKVMMRVNTYTCVGP